MPFPSSGNVTLDFRNHRVGKIKVVILPHGFWLLFALLVLLGPRARADTFAITFAPMLTYVSGVGAEFAPAFPPLGLLGRFTTDACEICAITEAAGVVLSGDGLLGLVIRREASCEGCFEFGLGDFDPYFQVSGLGVYDREAHALTAFLDNGTAEFMLLHPDGTYWIDADPVVESGSYSIQQTPEPTSFFLLGSSILLSGAAFRRWRKCW
jgi:hypothetical protein